MLILLQRLEDRGRYRGPYHLFHQHVLCRGLCPGCRAYGIVCGGCSGQRSLSELCVLLGKSSWKGQGWSRGANTQKRKDPKEHIASYLQVIDTIHMKSLNQL